MSALVCSVLSICNRESRIVRSSLVRLDSVVGLAGNRASDGTAGLGDIALESSGGGGEGDSRRSSASQHTSRTLRSEGGHGARR